MEDQKPFGTRDFRFNNTPNNGLIPVIVEKIDYIDKMLCRIEERQAEYHGYVKASLRRLDEDATIRAEALAQISKAVGTILERTKP